MTGEITVPIEDIPLATCLNLEEPLSATCEDWIAAQKSDKFISKIVAFITEGEHQSAKIIEVHHIERQFLRNWNNMFIEDGVLFRRGEVDCQTWNQLVLPRKLYDCIPVILR